MSATTNPEAELREKIIKLLMYEENADPSERDPVYIPVANNIMHLFAERERAIRADERIEVALDNYRGQTFSSSTDYKGKFDKFVTNNEKRITQLKAEDKS